MDVRCKFLLFIIINIVSFITKDILFGSMVFAVVLLLAFFIGQYKIAFKYLGYYVVLLSVLGVCIYLPTAAGSLITMVGLFVRMFLPIIFSAQVLIMSTAVSDLITAMYYFHIPRGFTISFAVAIRFFPTIREEFGHIKEAMGLRGLEASVHNICRHPIRCYENALVPLMMRASTISEELSAASVSRGIDNPGRRSSFRKLKATRKDAVITFLFSFLFLGILVIRQFVWGGA